MSTQADLVARSGDLVRAVLADGAVDEHRDALADLDRDALRGRLTAPAAKTAFWLNVYNGLVRHRLLTDPDAYDSRRRFFRREFLTVAGESLSPNDVEHGMLRSSMASWGFGYVPRFFPGDFERALRLPERDPRVHFALNCGARSCPAIEVYAATNVDDRLDQQTGQHLRETVALDREAGTVTVPKLFWWYRGDFGGKAGVLDFLHRHGAVPPGLNPSLRYGDWDWTLDV
jgi:hypothetical protein